MSSLNKLLQILDRRNKNDQYTNKIKKQISKQQLIQQISRNKQEPWRANSIKERAIDIKPLRNKCLNNWEILRVNLSDRSFSKNYKSVKIPSISRAFVNYDSKDKQGHLPYLYQSDIPKINRIRSSIDEHPFKVVTKTQKPYFGVGMSRITNSLATSRFSPKNDFS